MGSRNELRLKGEEGEELNHELLLHIEGSERRWLQQPCWVR